MSHRWGWKYDNKTSKLWCWKIQSQKHQKKTSKQQQTSRTARDEIKEKSAAGNIILQIHVCRYPYNGTTLITSKFMQEYQRL